MSRGNWQRLQAMQLPVPYDEIIRDFWISDPRRSPPDTPIEVPGACEGRERNVLGVLLDFMQLNAERSALGCYTYNLFANDEFASDDFATILETCLWATGALFEAGFANDLETASEDAVKIFYEYVMLKVGAATQEIQEVDDSGIDLEAEDIRRSYNELKSLVAEYQNMFRANNRVNNRMAGRGRQTGGWGGSRQGSRFGREEEDDGRSFFQGGGGRFGGARNAPQTSSRRREMPKKDMFGGRSDHRGNAGPEPTTKGTGMSSIQRVRNRAQGAQEPEEQVEVTRKEDNPIRRGWNTWKGNDDDEATVLREARKISGEDGSDWIVTKPGMYLKRTWSPKMPHALVYDVDYETLVYHVVEEKTGREIVETCTERDGLGMGAGYDKHELIFEDRKNTLASLKERQKTSINEVYHRETILAAADDEEVDVFDIRRFNLCNASLDQGIAVTCETFRSDCGNDDAVVVANVKEEHFFVAGDDVKEVFQTLVSHTDLISLQGFLKETKDKISQQLMIAIDNTLVKAVNRVLEFDYNLQFGESIDSFVDDASDMMDGLGSDYSLTFARGVEKTILKRVKAEFADCKTSVSKEDTDGVGVRVDLIRHHTVIDIPLCTSALRLGGSEKGRGYISPDSALVFHRLLTTVLGQTEDYIWVHTADNNCFEVRRSPLAPSQWIIDQVDTFS